MLAGVSLGTISQNLWSLHVASASSSRCQTKPSCQILTWELIHILADVLSHTSSVRALVSYNASFHEMELLARSAGGARAIATLPGSSLSGRFPRCQSLASFDGSHVSGQGKSSALTWWPGEFARSWLKACSSPTSAPPFPQDHPK